MFESRPSKRRHRDVPANGSGSLPWDLEGEALTKLARFDLQGCRETLARLVDTEPGRGREWGLFLHDVLCQIHRFLARAPEADDRLRDRRARILQAFAAADDPASVRRAFLEQVDALLGPFQRGTRTLNPVVEQARRYIEDNSTAKLSLSQIAEHVNVSRNYLSTLFKKQCGSTITDFIHQVRMQRAELLLLAGGRTISEVAYMVGYQNYRDFYRNFVKFTNSSPKRFRQSLGSRSGDGKPAPSVPSDGERDRALPRP